MRANGLSLKDLGSPVGPRCIGIGWYPRGCLGTHHVGTHVGSRGCTVSQPTVVCRDHGERPLEVQSQDHHL